MDSLSKLILVAALMTGTAASAQDMSGSPARRAQDIFENPVNERYYFERYFPKELRTARGEYASAMRFAYCSANLDVTGARQVVAGDAGSDAEAAAITALAKRHGKCINSREQIPTVLLRGAFAEALWKHDGALANPARRTAVDMSDIEAFFKASPRGDMVSKSGALPIAWVARCQAMALPNQSAQLLATAPGTPAEQAAAAELYAKSGVCGIAQGLGATPVALARAGIADALYQNVVRSKAGESSR